MFKLRCSHRRNERTNTRGEKGRNQVLQPLEDKPKKKKKKKKRIRRNPNMRKPFVFEVDLEEELEKRSIKQPYCASFLPIGWKELFLSALDAAIATGWKGVGLAQFKQKFGALRVYIDDAPDAVDRIFAHAEYVSKHTCEACGKHDPDRVDVSFRFGSTLCGACAKKA